MVSLSFTDLLEAIAVITRLAAPKAKVTTQHAINFAAGNWSAPLKSDTDNKRVHIWALQPANQRRKPGGLGMVTREPRISIIGVIETSYATAQIDLLAEAEAIADALTLQPNLGIVSDVAGHDELQIVNADLAALSPPSYFIEAELVVRLQPKIIRPA